MALRDIFRSTKIGEISVEKKAYVVPPKKNDFSGNPNMSIHGVVGAHSHNYYNHIREGKVWLNNSLREKYLRNNIENAEMLEGVWLYGGPIFFHFGHFLSESIHRLWPLKDNSRKYQGVIFIVPPWFKGGWDELPGYCRSVLEKFEIPDVMFCRGLLQIEELHISKPGSMLGVNSSQWYLNMMDQFPIFNLQGQGVGDKVFFSRRNYMFKGRSFGLNSLSEQFVADGYIEICPENYSLQEQVDILLNSKFAIFEEGSAVHLLELLPKTVVKTYLIQRRANAGNLHKVLKEKTNFVGFYDDVTLIEPVAGEGGFNRNSFINNPAGLVEDLVGYGFISKESGLSLESFVREVADNVNDYINFITGK